MIELAIILSIISGGSGYLLNEAMQPIKICQTIKDIPTPKQFTEPYAPPRCKEGIDPITKLDNTCMIKTPRYVISEENYKIYYMNHIGEARTLLNTKSQLIKDHKEKPYIIIKRQKD